MIKIHQVIFALYHRINKNITQFSIPVSQQIEYLNRFPKPVNDIERSYYQYKCQIFFDSSFQKYSKQVISFICFFPFLFYLLIRKRNRSSVAYGQQSAVVLTTGANNVDYQIFKSVYDTVEIIDFASSYYLTWRDLKFVGKLLWVHPFSFYWCLKNMYKIAIYRAIFDKYLPTAIICSSEYSFTSSVLTWYCNSSSVDHIDVMHGEKLFYIGDAFFHFNRCYVWDEHYIGMFRTLRAYCDEYQVHLPSSCHFKLDAGVIGKYTFTYYLDVETEDELYKIRDSLLNTGVDPARICVRYHPRYYDLKLIERIFEGFVIEDPHMVDLICSFLNTSYIVSLYSTVLFQAYNSGKDVVIDDLSFPQKYERLLDLSYIMINKKHIKLSDFKG